MGVEVGVAPAARARFSGVSLTTPLVLEGLLIGGAALYVVAFIGAALLRLSFPYPLEITEGASLEQVRGILRGQPLYVAPTLEYVPMTYGPAYYYAAALVSLVVGPSYGALRAVSLAASIGSIALVGLIVKRETGNRLASVVAAGVFAASYPLGDATLDLARVDATMLALMLGAMYLVRLEGVWVTALGGALMALAVLTKQAAAPLAAILLAYLILVDHRRAPTFSVALVVMLILPLLVLELQSGPWATLFLVQLPGQHAISDLRLDQFWRLWILPRFTLALPLGLLFLLGRVQVKDHRATLYYALVGVGMLGISWASDANPGASLNVLLPAYAMLSILFGLGLHEGLRQLSRLGDRSHTYWAFAACFGLLQLVLMIYNPRLLVPYRSDGWADDRLASTLDGLPGNVFAPDFDAFTRARTDAAEQPYAGAFAELLGGYGGHAVPEGGALLQTLRDRLTHREYDYVVLDPDSQWFFFSGTLRDAGYVDAGPLFPPGDEFWLWRTSVSPKSELYVPRERVSQLPGGATT